MDQVADRVFVETRYAGVNVGAVQTKKGIICIDAPSYPRDARDWVAQLHQIDARPIRYVALTNGHGDRILNTRWLGGQLIAQDACAHQLESYDRRLPQSVLDSLFARNPEASRELSSAATETVTIRFSDSLMLYFYGHPLELRHVDGPGDGSAIAVLHEDRLVFTGDVLVAGTHPMLVNARPVAWLESLAELQDLADEGYAMIPGRGLIGDPESIACLAEFLAEVRCRVADLATRPKSRSELNACANDLLSRYPLGRLPRDWALAQIKAGLDQLIEEMRTRTALAGTGAAH